MSEKDKEEKQAKLPTTYKEVKNEKPKEAKDEVKETPEEVYNRVMKPSVPETKVMTKEEAEGLPIVEKKEVTTEDSTTKQKKEWEPLNGTPEEPEEPPQEKELPCEGCLEKATNQKQSWVRNVEEQKRTEKALMQELSEKQAKHEYQVARDAKLINTQIFIARRLGELCHIMRKRLELDQQYYELAQSKTGGQPKKKRKQENPYEAQGIYKDLADYRHLLIMEEKGDELQIRPRLYLGQERWKEVMDIVNKYEGEWNSKGKNSYWSAPLPE